MIIFRPMCGRYTRAFTKDHLFELLQAILQDDLEPESFPDIPPSWNVAPTQQVLALGKSQPDHKHKFSLLQWGFIPSFVKQTMTENPINARAETIADKPMFRAALSRRRCLILADGFYEWQRGTHTPFYFHFAGPVAFGGIYDVWNGRATCAIITTAANEMVAAVNPRMPLIISPENYSLWCDPEQTSLAIKHLFAPYPSEDMQVHAVSSRVNTPANNDPELISPVALS